MREGDSRSGSRAEGSADTWDDLERDACRGESLDLFPSPGKEHRVASLEADHPSTGTSMVNDQIMNQLLARGGSPPPLAHRHHRCFRRKKSPEIRFEQGIR